MYFVYVFFQFFKLNAELLRTSDLPL